MNLVNIPKLGDPNPVTASHPGAAENFSEQQDICSTLDPVPQAYIHKE